MSEPMLLDVTEATPARSRCRSRSHSSRPEEVSLAGAEHSCITYWLSGPRVGLQWAIEASGRRYHLRELLAVSFKYMSGGIVVASKSDVGVHAHGRSVLEALEAFCEMFDSQYRELVECPEDELTPYAMQFRRKFLQLVEGVEPLPVSP